MRHDCIGLRIYGRFQHHLIPRIAQLRTPQKVQLTGRDGSSHIIQEYINLGTGDPGVQKSLGPGQHIFLLVKQGD